MALNRAPPRPRFSYLSPFAWKRRLASSPEAAAFVEAKLAASDPHVTQAGAKAIELRLRHRRVIRVCYGLDANLLAQLVRTLKALP